MRTKFWKTREGRKVRVIDMEDGHLMNTIAFLERWAQRSLDLDIHAMIEEAQCRGLKK